MSAAPAQTLRIAGRASRRAFVADSIGLSGRILSIAFGAAIAAVALDKLGGPAVGRPALIALAGGAGLAISLAWAFSRRWSIHRGAVELDERLGLKSRLSTAVALSAARSGDPFEHWAIGEAARVASAVAVERAVPIKFDWLTGLWPVLAAIAIAGALFVPRLERPAPGRRDPTAAERAQAAAEIRHTADAVRRGMEGVPEATQEQLRTLEELERELSQGRGDPEQAAARTAKSLEDMARRMETDAAAERARSDALREQLAKAAAKQDDPAGASSVMRSLESGDVEAAAEQLQRAARDPDSMTQAEREQLARDLESLANAMDREAPSGADARKEGSAASPASQGATGSTGATAGSDPSTQQGPSGAKGETGPTTEPRAEPRESPAEDSSQRLNESLREAAKDLRRPPDRASGQPPTSPAGRPAPSGAQPSTPRESQPSPAPSGPSGNTGGTTGASAPSAESGGQQRDAKSRPEQSENSRGSSGQTGSTGASGMAGASGASAPSSASGSTGSSGESGRTGSSGGVPRPSEQPGASGSSGAAAQEPSDIGETHEKGAASPSGTPTGNSPEHGERSVPSAERLAKELKRLADGAGERDIERSRQLREMARKQLEQSTPQQREELRRLAEQFARGGGVGKEPASPGSAAHRPFEPATAPVDARQPASVSGLERPPERTIAEWYSDKPASGASGSAPPSEAFRQAAQGAERAIEQQQVPGRYQDLVRRVFRRYSEQAAPK